MVIWVNSEVRLRDLSKGLSELGSALRVLKFAGTVSNLWPTSNLFRATVLAKQNLSHNHEVIVSSHGQVYIGIHALSAHRRN